MKRILKNKAMKKIIGQIVVAFCITSASKGAAEVIFLKSGTHVQGKILKEDDVKVVVDAGVDVPVTYYKEDIKNISRDLPYNPLAMKHADALEAKAVELIDGNHMNEGLDMMRQALILAPNANRHMNYGSVLFGNGVMLFKENKKEQGRQVLQQAEEELNKASALFQVPKDSFLMAQCFYLLGEMYAHAFDDKAKAQDYYQEAVELAAHPGAIKALKNLTK